MGLNQRRTHITTAELNCIENDSNPVDPWSLSAIVFWADGPANKLTCKILVHSCLHSLLNSFKFASPIGVFHDLLGRGISEF